MTEYRTIAAVEAMEAGLTRSQWNLADAINMDLAERGEAAPNAVLEDIRNQLIERGYSYPYSVRYLREMAHTATVWLPEFRMPEAAFRTHKDATRSPRSAELLIALCCVAAGDDKTNRPTEIEPDAWHMAVSRVRKRRDSTRTPRYLVAGDDLFAGLGQSMARPPKVSEPVTVIAVLGELGHLTTSVLRLNRHLSVIEPKADDVQAMVRSIDQLMDVLAQAREVFSEKYLDDELAALVSKETR